MLLNTSFTDALPSLLPVHELLKVLRGFSRKSAIVFTPSFGVYDFSWKDVPAEK